MRSVRFLLSALLVFPSLQGLRAQKPAPPQHPTSTPYAGDLSIFEAPDRAKNLQIERVMDLLGLKPGKVVADIGAGGGWFTVRAAKRVAGGPDGGGKVIAEDINPLPSTPSASAPSRKTCSTSSPSSARPTTRSSSPIPSTPRSC